MSTWMRWEFRGNRTIIWSDLRLRSNST
jgi:hypothetical protein